MSWNIPDLLDMFFNALNLLDTGSGNRFCVRSKSKKARYIIEKISSGFIVIACTLLFFVFRDPLPPENLIQTVIVASVIGLSLSFLLFFVLYISELYYFKNLFQLLLFSCSVIISLISIVLWIYFRSGVFV